MTSAVYRQTSEASPSALEHDPDNSLLSRFPLRRLDAEVIYDAILKASGRLDTEMGGPSDEIEVTKEGEVLAKPRNGMFRRSIYLIRRRSTPLSLLEVYDAPRMEPNCLARNRSTVPTQALQTWNGQRVRESSRYFAGRVVDSAGEDIVSQIDRVYLAALTRLPTDQERNVATETLRQLSHEWLDYLHKNAPEEPRQAKAQWLALATFCHTILNSAEFIYVD
jgi:hypothetical protein